MIVGIRGVGGRVAEIRGVGSGVAEVCGREVSSMGDAQPASRPKIRAAIEIASFALFTRFIIHAQPDPCNPPYSLTAVLFDEAGEMWYIDRYLLEAKGITHQGSEDIEETKEHRPLKFS